MDESIYYKRTMIKEQLSSAYLPEPRSLRIVLPPGYNELLSYPVIYCQDGEDFINFGRIATQLTRLVLDEGLEPAILVAVDVDKKVRTDEYAPEGSRFEAYCRFFAEELIPHIESRYPARPQPDARILAGDSLGGTVSLHLALDYPQLSTRVISLSGALLTSTQERLQREERDLAWLDLYMLIGLDEEQVETTRGVFDFLQANRDTLKLLHTRNAKVTYVEKPGKHLWGFWQTELPYALHHVLG
ncbi:alpha/beta hydrolase [Paenibacillus koleovorans]|uniref:alpha/beta hydrolase n=1 Tax=Paenibacillus koleovorans TaxID=121608 RepID=UPI000FDBB4AA|nr:alpha/beta hydrolase-fold protein [Paenibacillus koleovorans]